MQGSDQSASANHIGSKMFIYGLAFQLVSYGLFILLVIKTHLNVRKGAIHKLRPVSKLMIGMYISSAMVLVGGLCSFH